MIKKLVILCSLLLVLSGLTSPLKVQANDSIFNRVDGLVDTWVGEEITIEFQLNNLLVRSVKVYDPNGIEVDANGFLGNYSFQASMSGDYLVKVTSLAGKQLQEIIKVNYVDNEAPKVELSLNNQVLAPSNGTELVRYFVMDSPLVYINASDNASGVKSISYQITDYLQAADPNNWTSGKVVELLENKLQTLHVLVSDNAGNEVEVASYGIANYQDIIVANKVAQFSLDSESSANDDVVFEVDLNNNQIAKIVHNDQDLRVGMDYEVKANQIIFKKAYLQHVLKEKSSFEVYLKPLGHDFYEESINTPPPVTTLEIEVIEDVEKPELISNLVNEEIILIGDELEPLIVNAKVKEGKLTYQWFKNQEPIEGATNNFYTPSTKEVGVNEYHVEITNTNNEVDGKKAITITSNISKVMVNKVEVIQPNQWQLPIKIDLDAISIFNEWKNNVDYKQYLDGKNFQIKLDAQNIANYSPSTLEQFGYRNYENVQSLQLKLSLMIVSSNNEIANFDLKNLSISIQLVYTPSLLLDNTKILQTVENQTQELAVIRDKRQLIIDYTNPMTIHLIAQKQTATVALILGVIIAVLVVTIVNKEKIINAYKTLKAKYFK